MIADKWTQRYLSIAHEVSQWSKDRTKVGAVAVGRHGQILSQGYNGFARGVLDDESRILDRPTKLKYTIHAEMNCIFNASLTGVSLHESDLYVSGLPICCDCAKGIIQVGVKRVFMRYDESSDSTKTWRESYSDSRIMFKEAGVEAYRSQGETLIDTLIDE